jgi:hypothetical protein
MPRAGRQRRRLAAGQRPLGRRSWISVSGDARGRGSSLGGEGCGLGGRERSASGLAGGRLGGGEWSAVGLAGGRPGRRRMRAWGAGGEEQHFFNNSFCFN